MYKVNDNKQQDLFDHWGFMGPSRRKLLEDSWAGLFRNDILHMLPVDKLKPAFHSTMGRPSKELYTLMGIMIFQQMFDKSDEEAVEALCFDIKWHYALNIQGESDHEKYISQKTLWSARQILIEHSLEDLVFKTINNALVQLFNVDTSLQRIDSVHVKSNMRKLGRIGIFSKTIHKFLTNLKRQYRKEFESLNQELCDRYLKKNALSSFAMVKPSETSKTLEVVSKDMFDLIQYFKDQISISNMTSYKLMERVLDEHCIINRDDPSEVKVELKLPKEISSDSLQNPSDPDAGYSGHKGQGYQAQVQETFTAEEDPEKKAETLNLITHVEVESASKSDSNALVPAIEATEKNGMSPKKLLADTLYGGDDNINAAAAKSVELIAPAPGRKTIVGLNGFTLDGKGHINQCPKGYSPKTTKYKKAKGSFSCGFDAETCQSCELFEECPSRPGKRYYYVRYTDKDLRLVKRRHYEQTEEFKSMYNWRAGVEATMSQLDRRTGAKHLRVRGLKAVRYCIILKAVGVNLLRAAAARKSRVKHEPGPLKPFSAFWSAFVRFRRLISGFVMIKITFSHDPLEIAI